MLSVETVRFLGSRWLPVFFFFTSFTCLSLKIHQQILCFVFIFFSHCFSWMKTEDAPHCCCFHFEFEFEFKQNVCFKKTSIFNLFWVFFVVVVFPEIPDPPTDLELTDQTERSVQLTWIPGDENNSPTQSTPSQILQYMHYMYFYYVTQRSLQISQKQQFPNLKKNTVLLLKTQGPIFS